MTCRRLSRARFRDALAKGLGRALLATRAEGRLVDEDAVLDACLHNRSYDPQVEGSRAPWLLEILGAAGATDRFRAPILAALSQSSNTWDLEQLCDFAEVFANQGIGEARSALYETRRRRPDPTAPWLAEEQIVRLDGLEGFLYLAEQQGAAIRRGEAGLEPERLVWDADASCGSEAVARLLAGAAGSSPDLRAFSEQLNEERQARQAHQRAHKTLSERMAAIAAEQVVAFVEGQDDSPGMLPLTYWGRFAGKESLQAVAFRLFLERDPAKLVNYLKVFAKVPLPEFDDRLISLSEHPDRNVRQWVSRALAANRSPKVRLLALQRLETGQDDGNAIALLEHNYEPGDHRLIEPLLNPRADPDELHRLCWSLGDVFEHNETSECAKPLRFAYEHTPCSHCRKRFVTVLLKADRLPAHLREECQFDANADIRDLMRSP